MRGISGQVTWNTHAFPNTRTLVTFKPKRILDFITEPVEANWDPKRLEKVEGLKKQLDMLMPAGTDRTSPLRKLPFKFSYLFEDEEGKKSTLMIEDWEIGALYWNCLRTHEGNKNKAVRDVVKKYWDDFAQTKDTHLILGTTLKFQQMKAPNPFLIVGVFAPPVKKQQELAF